MWVAEHLMTPVAAVSCVLGNLLGLDVQSHNLAQPPCKPARKLWL